MSKIKFHNKEYLLSHLYTLIHCAKNECLIMLGDVSGNNDTQYCLGIGLVKYIEKGQDFDVVKMTFGTKMWREVIVRDNHARRQVYTLKRGQYCWFYGKRRFYKRNDKVSSSYYAIALQGWYVPKNLDIKQIGESELARLSQDNEKVIADIDKLLNEEE